MPQKVQLTQVLPLQRSWLLPVLQADLRTGRPLKPVPEQQLAEDLCGGKTNNRDQNRFDESNTACKFDLSTAFT